MWYLYNHIITCTKSVQNSKAVKWGHFGENHIVLVKNSRKLDKKKMDILTFKCVQYYDILTHSNIFKAVKWQKKLWWNLFLVKNSRKLRDNIFQFSVFKMDILMCKCVQYDDI